MPFQIVHNDICKMKTDAIVNAANSKLQMGGGVCGAIFAKAGAAQLQEECNSIGSCAVGHAVITKGYRLAAKYIIHAVGPIYKDGKSREKEFLSMAYRSSLELAKENGISSIAFPLISSGIYGYPKEEALSVAIKAIQEFLDDNEMMVYLVVFDRTAVQLSEEKLSKIEHYIHTYYQEPIRRKFEHDFDQIFDECSMSAPIFACKTSRAKISEPKRNLDELLSHMEETFTQMLFRLIDEKGLTDVEVYKKANLDRKLFSKIRSNMQYTPKKATVLALAIGMELSLDETKDLLSRAGYAFSQSQKFDVIIQFFIENKQFNIFEINETLFYFEQPLLGINEIK